MDDISPFIHFSAISLVTVLPALSVSFGQALIGLAGIKALVRQPAARSELMRTQLTGMALTETAAILALGVAIMLLSETDITQTAVYSNIAKVGIVCAIAIPGTIIGFTAAQPTISALNAIARQPFFARKITNMMLLTQSLGQTGTIFGLIIALLIKANLSSITSINQALQCLASGLALGLGCVGPLLGLGYFAQVACKTVGCYPQAYRKILTFTFISEAIIETPLIFSLLVALIIMGLPLSHTFLERVVFISAALCIGIGTYGPGINSGKVAATACTIIAQKPEEYNTLSRLSLIAQALIDTGALYALLVSFILLLTHI